MSLAPSEDEATPLQFWIPVRAVQFAEPECQVRRRNGHPRLTRPWPCLGRTRRRPGTPLRRPPRPRRTLHRRARPGRMGGTSQPWTSGRTTSPWTAIPQPQPMRAHADHHADHSPVMPAATLVARLTTYSVPGTTSVVSVAAGPKYRAQSWQVTSQAGNVAQSVSAQSVWPSLSSKTNRVPRGHPDRRPVDRSPYLPRQACRHFVSSAPHLGSSLVARRQAFSCA